MVFSSLIFLFVFLPVVLIVYFSVKNNTKNLVLFISSLIFYTWGEQEVVLVMLLSTVIDFNAGKLIELGKRKLGLYLSILSNLGFLFFFKYFNFTFDNFNSFLSFFNIQSESLSSLPYIALPIGISFYTFQTMSYTIDVYRGEVKASKNFIQFACYVTMFPQLVAGPIVRYKTIEAQIKDKNISLNRIREGFERFLIGLAKKVLIANTFASICDGILGQEIQDVSSPLLWLAIISYSFQIYFDFSGYSDMAIGLGKMMGFDFLENFNYPYISKSIKEFWRRWHISLSTWFRDYVYISLGGNRFGTLKTYRNLFIVFVVTGFWHGASWNFMIWGIYHGLFLIFERLGLDKILKRYPDIVQHIYTLLVVMVGWMIFRVENLSDIHVILKKMFIYDPGDLILNSYLIFNYVNFKTCVFFVIAILFSLPVFKIIDDRLLKNEIIRFSFFGSLFFISLVFLSSSGYNPFIYFRF